MKTADILKSMQDGTFNVVDVKLALMNDAKALINARSCKTPSAIKACYLEQLTKYSSAYSKFIAAGGKASEGIFTYTMLHAFHMSLPGMFYDELAKAADATQDKHIHGFFTSGVEAIKEKQPDWDEATVNKAATHLAILAMADRTTEILIKDDLIKADIEVALTEHTKMLVNLLSKTKFDGWFAFSNAEIVKFVIERSLKKIDQSNITLD